MTAVETLGICHPKHLFIFGLGYSASWLARSLIASGWSVAGTVRSHGKAAEMRAMGIRAHIFDGDKSNPGPDHALITDLRRAPYVLHSVGLVDGLDPIVPTFAAHLRASAVLAWVGYLSTTVVYGDHGGGWVNETTIPTPQTDRGRARLNAERVWADLGLPLHIFRLAGIYGPGRNPLVKIQNGKAQTYVKPGQVFSRIHVADIAQLLRASMAQPTGTAQVPAIYNGADDLSAPPQDVTAFAAALLNQPAPPEIAFDPHAMTPMARSFYADNKRVDNAKMRALVGTLVYPTYIQGLRALAREMHLPNDG